MAFDISRWASNLAGSTQDIISGQSIIIANGADLSFELAFYDAMGAAMADGNLIDFTDIDHVVVALQETLNPHNATQYWSYTINNASINNTLTTAQWTGAQPNTLCHVNVLVPNTNNSFTLDLKNQQYFWLCIYGVTNDATPKQVPYAFFQVAIVDTGMPVSNPVLPTPFKAGSTLYFLCSDGLSRAVQVTQQSNGNWTLTVNQAGTTNAGLATISMFCSDNNYRDLTLQNIGGAWTLVVNQDGHNP